MFGQFGLDLTVTCIVCVVVSSVILGIIHIVDLVQWRRKEIGADVEFDAAIVGPPCSGKTTLFELLVNNKFTSTYSTTQDRELASVQYVFAMKEANGEVRNINVKINLWSLAGQNNIKGATHRRAYLRGIDVIFYVAPVLNAVARAGIGPGVDMYLKYAMKTPNSPVPATAILLNKSDLIGVSGNTSGNTSIVNRNMYRVSKLPEWIPRGQCKSFVTSFKNEESHTDEEKIGYFGFKTDTVKSGDVCETLITWAVNRYLGTRRGEEVVFVRKL